MMKNSRKILILISILIVFSLVPGIALGASDNLDPTQLVKEDGVTPSGTNGKQSVFDGVTYTNVAQDFWRGYDSEGNLCFQSENNGAFTAFSDRVCLVDGFAIKFRITPLSTPQVGCAYGVGLARSAFGQTTLGLKFTYNSAGTFDVAWISSGMNVFPETLGSLKLSPDTFYEVKYYNLSQEEATAKGLSDTIGWCISVNGVFYDIDDSHFVKSWAGSAHDFPVDGSGEYYGYFSFISNCYFGSDTYANNGIRFTISRLVTDGSDGISVPVQGNDADSYPSGILPGATKGNFEYSTARSGVYKGTPRIFAADGNVLSFTFSDQTILNGTEYDFRIIKKKANGKISLYFKASNTPGTYANGVLTDSDYFGLNFYRTGMKTASCSITVNGSETSAADSIYFDWTGKEENSVSLFVTDVIFFTVNGNVVEFSDSTVLDSFTKDGNNMLGYLYVQSDANETEILNVKTIFDGSAVRKLIAREIVTLIEDVNLNYGETVDESVLYPETVTVKLDDGTTREWNVSWVKNIDTTVPGIVEVSGAFSDLEELKNTYMIPQSIIGGLSFSANVALREGYVRYGTSAYSGNWISCGGGSNNFYYEKDSDGTEHIVSDLFGSNRQWMPADINKYDIDDYSITFSLRSFSDTNMLGFMFMPERKHPVEFGNIFMGVWLNVNASSGSAYFNYASSLGNAEAFFKDGSGNLTREIAFDASGVKQYRLRVDVVDSDIGIFFLADGTEYEIIPDPKVTLSFFSLLDKFTDGKGYVMLWNEVGSTELNFKQTYNKYIVSYEKPESAVIDFGAENSLPTEINATLNDGSVIKAKVEYRGDYSVTVPGIYTLTGVVGSDEEIGKDGVIFQDVESEFIVSLTVREEIKIITSFPKQENQTIGFGENYNLPDEVTVEVYSSVTHETEEVTIGITWSGDFNKFVPGDYVLTASPVGNYRFDEALTGFSTVVTVKADEENKTGSGCNSSLIGTIQAIVAVLGITFIGLKKK